MLNDLAVPFFVPSDIIYVLKLAHSTYFPNSQHIHLEDTDSVWQSIRSMYGQSLTEDSGPDPIVHLEALPIGTL